MTRFSFWRRLLMSLTAACAGVAPLGAAEAAPDASKLAPSKAEEEFFERQVRPLLVAHCVTCHGPKKQEMGLRLDSAAALKKGSESGPVVVPGSPDESPLIEALRYGGATKMPPTGKLPAQAIETLTAWVKMGAPWPHIHEQAANAAEVSLAEKARSHWAFQPLRVEAVPKMNDPSAVGSAVDAFIVERLQGAGLQPSPRADRRTLLRRATFDLHGLPPTPEENAAFEMDSSPDAFDQVVERLLASPRYGERWGRHWLDVARYADTKGYVRLNENPKYPSAWTYRDYVIRSFNDDLPYVEFVLQQLAADQLDLHDDPRPLAAMGFLTVGQRFINSRNDIIDDRIDVVTRGFLGLTVTCARRHDHKFDAIPTRDYYSLHGVFASSLEPHVPPVAVPRWQRDRHTGYLTELKRRTDKFDEFLRGQHAELTAAFRAKAGAYLLKAHSEQVQANFLAVMFLVDATKELNPVMVQRWARFLEQSRKGHDSLFAPWHDLARLAAHETFTTKMRELVASWRRSTSGPKYINQVVVESLARDPPRNLAEAAAKYGDLLQAADARWRQAIQADPAARRLPDADWEQLRQFLDAKDSPLGVSLADVEQFLFVDTAKQSQLHQQQRLVEDWIATPGAAPHAMTLVDVSQPADSPVFIRGNASNPGETAPRQFLAVATRGERRPFQHGSGRLELARAIASAENPLTARVIVNRVWQHHFGAGLVRTPSDFGVRGEPPTHPQLLDYLAARFVADGWSIKKLHRLLMLSATYQQQSAGPTEVAARRDPENALLSRMNRRRLDWEGLRDSLLAVSGQLDVTLSGPAIDLFQPPFSPRRSIYGVIDRQSLPGALRAFDFVPPDATSPQRHQTTVPQQALFLMNSPFLQEQVRRLAARTEIATRPTPRERIDALHRLLFGRAAQPEDIGLGERYLQPMNEPPLAASHGAAARQFLSPWEEYVQALVLSNEFMFVD